MQSLVGCVRYPAMVIYRCVQYLAHPATPHQDAGDFAPDQYAACKGTPIAEVERWLASRLAYEPMEEEAKGVRVAA